MDALNLVTATPETIAPDALLVQRIAALGDRAALAELDARHGMTLYAVAYGLALDPQAADAAVSAAFREVWRSAASFDAAKASVQRWLAELTRRAVQDWESRAPKPSVAVAAHPLYVPPVKRRRRRFGALLRLIRVAATLLLPSIIHA